MRTTRYLGSYKRDRKRVRKRGKDLAALETVIHRLACGERLEARFEDHKLGGQWRDYRECHIESDWLLIYQLTDHEIVLARTGTHADLFE